VRSVAVFAAQDGHLLAAKGIEPRDVAANY